jgi:hypothetical protein
MDTRREDVRELMRDIDMRLSDKREARIRWIGVICGMGIIFGCWLIPGYWALRGTLYPGVPMLFDQWVLMAVIGFGIIKILERVTASRRFPYLDDNLQIR